MFNKKNKPSDDIAFLAAYHTARLAEFEHVHSSGNSIDTKSSALIAGNFALIALLYTQDVMSLITYLTLAFAAANIILGLWAIFIRNQSGPVANVDFKNDTQKGDEARVLLQLIEDTESFTNENLRTLHTKKWLWRVQSFLLVQTLIIMLLEKIICKGVL